MNILFFEDNFVEKLSPLSLLRPVYYIKCGIFSPKDNAVNYWGKKAKFFFHTRPLLTSLSEETHGKNNFTMEGECLLLNGRVYFNNKLFKKLTSNKIRDFILVSGETVIAAKFTLGIPANLKDIFVNSTLSFSDFLQTKYEIINANDILSKDENFLVFENPWDYIKYFDEIFPEDINHYKKNFNEKIKTRKEIAITGKDKVFISPKAVLHPAIVLDASEGEIILDDYAVIEPFTYIKGPIYAGKYSLIKSHSKIYGPVSIGEYSKVSGEIGHTIFHSYANKQHDGYIGHSYVCPFVNLGADTVTSNLKNNYSKITVQNGTERAKTDMQFLGSLIGDHTKIGINTMLNTGTIIGIFSNIAGGGFPDKYVPSFSWYIVGMKLKKYNLEECLTTARTVMHRRNIEITPAYENLVRELYKI
jgi:UDP-N-acetylglucosamine diphosphorylase/glucosamine-1-phosphate N-acetyltransferase